MKAAFWRRLVIASAIAAAVALLIGVVAYALGVNDGFGRRTQSNFVPVMLLLGSVLLLAAGAMLACHAPEAANKVPVLSGILTLSLVASFFVLLYFRHVWPLVFFPADILGWSESPFLDFIIRFRAGEPLFTPVEDGNAFPYPPLAALVTYGMVKVAGMEASVPAMRVVQQLFLLMGALFVASAVRALLRHLRPETRYANWWMLFWAPILFLVATDENVNPWVVTLHTDALALALHCFAFWLLVQHATSRNDRWLIIMVLLPSVGYLAKQNALAWAGIYCFYLMLREQPRIRQILGFAAAVFSVWGLTLAGCYWLWGEVYFQWTFQTIGNLHVSLARIVQDLGVAGWYLFVGLLGAVAVMRGEHFRFLLPIWSSWLLLWVFLHYTMAAAHRTAHIGPACVIGMGWFGLALAYRWPGSFCCGGGSASRAMVAAARAQRVGGGFVRHAGLHAHPRCGHGSSASLREADRGGVRRAAARKRAAGSGQLGVPAGKRSDEGSCRLDRRSERDGDDGWLPGPCGTHSQKDLPQGSGAAVRGRKTLYLSRGNSRIAAPALPGNPCDSPGRCSPELAFPRDAP